MSNQSRAFDDVEKLLMRQIEAGRSYLSAAGVGDLDLSKPPYKCSDEIKLLLKKLHIVNRLLNTTKDMRIESGH